MADNKRIGKLIKNLRKSFGFTQDELASKLGVTSQAVSGWERGASQLSLDNLIALSKLFLVPTDYFLIEQSNNNDVFLGVDGGGTKTEFVVFKADGTILKRFILGPSNPNDISIDSSVSLLSNGIRECLLENLNIKYAYFGIAGALTGDNASVLRSRLASLYPSIEIGVGGDVDNIIGCAENADTVLISGTGIVAFALDKKGKRHQIGGWGYLLDDAGSGFDIGKDVIKTVLLERENNFKKSSITTIFEKDFPNLTNEQIIKNVYAKGKAYVAKFAYILFESCKEKDSVSSVLIKKHSLAIAGLISKAQKQYDCGRNVYFSGGIIKNYDSLLMPLIKANALFEYQIDDKPQVFGACKNCLNLCDKYHANFKESFIKNYKEISNV